MIPLLANIANGWDKFLVYSRSASSFWSQEVFSVDDHPITIQKIGVAILLMAVGLVVARRISSVVRKKVLKRTHLHQGASAAVESIIFYLLVVFFTLFALEVVHVPLTVFNLLGGALAIGVGFGSQNLMNNFISGLIVLFEQPVRVGDLIEIDGTQGRIQAIGARSTKILTGNNIHIIVPNSFFLEKNVINWTLTDESVRIFLPIAVGNENPPAKVKEILLEVVGSSREILADPEPLVVLYDLTQTGMIFRIYFWIRLNEIGSRLQVESDLRFQLLERFRAQGISLPHSQMEVSLFPKDTVNIKMLEGNLLAK